MSAQSPYRGPAQASPGYPAAQLPVKSVLFSFDGRIPRRTFWQWYLITFVAFGVIAGILAGAAVVMMKPQIEAASRTVDTSASSSALPSAGASPTSETGSTDLSSSSSSSAVDPSKQDIPVAALGIFAVIGLMGIPMTWIVFALVAKRWHDRGKSGWMCLLSFIPLVNIWALVEFGFLRGTVGPNQYGADPT